MDGVSVTRDTLRMMARVPEDMVSLPAEDDWAAWLSVTRAADGERDAVVLLSIAVTPYALPAAAGRALAAKLAARHPGPAAHIEEFSTPEGNPAARFRCLVTQERNGRTVTTAQAQVLVAFPGPGALAVVSGVALHPDDLDRAAELVAGIAARVTVTAASAAA
jgi:hypothetical protein